jgi:uncharacterized protein (DUF427 family)
MPDMKVPGPDHPITLAAAPGRMRALYHGHQIAESADVLMLKEANYPPVAYFPRDDVAMDYMSRTPHATHCPYKGRAAYFTLDMDGHIAENAIWSYEDPYPAMALIKDRLAFYPNVVEVTAAGPENADPEPVVVHTDSGSGASQEEHWPANVEEPGV